MTSWFYQSCCLLETFGDGNCDLHNCECMQWSNLSMEIVLKWTQASSQNSPWKWKTEIAPRRWLAKVILQAVPPIYLLDIIGDQMALWYCCDPQQPLHQTAAVSNDFLWIIYCLESTTVLILWLPYDPFDQLFCDVHIASFYQEATI